MRGVDLVYLLLYFTLRFFVWLLPDSALNSLSNAIATLAYKINHKHKKIIKANLRFCFPEKNEDEITQITKKIYNNFANFGFEFLKMQNATKEDIKELVSIDEMDILQKAFNTKRNIVFITAHFGCWELIPFIYASYFGGISIVTRTLDSKIMNDLLIKNRTKHFDVELIDKLGGAKKMLFAIKRGRSLGILSDQDAGDNESVVLEFFGKKVNWNIGASVIAKKTKALLIPAFVYQKKDAFDKNASKTNDFKGAKYSVKVFKPLDASLASKEELSIYQAKCCEEMIRAYPEEYFFFHKRFKRFYSEIYQA